MSVHEICFTVIVLLEKSQILFLGSRCQIGEFTYWTRSYWRLEGCCCSFVALDEASVGGARLLRQPWGSSSSSPAPPFPSLQQSSSSPCWSPSTPPLPWKEDRRGPDVSKLFLVAYKDLKRDHRSYIIYRQVTLIICHWMWEWILTFPRKSNFAIYRSEFLYKGRRRGVESK